MWEWLTSLWHRAAGSGPGSEDELHRTAYEVTEAIPVGTYTMVLPAGGGMARFSFMSTRFLELCGLDREAALADPFNAFACVHPDDYDAWVQKNTEVFAKKLPFFGETRIVVNGEIRWITAESTPRDLPDGSTVWEGVLIDITDRKQAEQRLADGEARLRSILDAVPVPLAITTRETNPQITFLNRSFVNTFGYTLDDIPTVADWGRHAYPDPTYRMAVFETWDDALADAAESGAPIGPFELEVRGKDGRRHHVLINAVTVLNESLVGLFDITDRLAAERREREMEETYRRTLEGKLKTSLTAAAIAHEINQPLSTILLQSKLALEGGNAEEVVTTIAAEAEQVVRTIDKMKVLLRNVQTEHQAVDLSEVVARSVLYMQERLADQAIRIDITGDEHPHWIAGDDVQLQLALNNVLRNSIESIVENAPERREIRITILVHENSVELVIGDSGHGWSGAERYETPLTTTKEAGTGIGLFVIRTTMHNHKGTVSFGDSPLGGAEVRLSFPRADGSGAGRP